MDNNRTRRSLLRAGSIAFGSGFLSIQVGAAEGDSDRYLVGTDSNDARRAARRQAEMVHHELDFGTIGSAIAGRFPEPAREALQRRNDVRYVEPDVIVDLVAQTVDDGVERIGALEAHDQGADGNDSHVAIIDTGIDSTHETLAPNLGEGYAPDPCSDGCDEEWDDTHGHGTGVAGVVGAADNGVGTLGVAHDCTLHAVRVMDGDTGAYVSDIAAGLEWTADQGHDVANMSLGADIESTTLQESCQYAHDNGVLLVAAAGNAGEETVYAPAKYETVIAVSATTTSDEFAWWSNYGEEIELTAPGTYITAPDLDDEYTDRNGTSFSAPHVAGTAALLVSNGATQSEARSRMAETAEDIGLDDNEQGNGLVDAAAAIDETGDDGDEADEEDDEGALTVTTNGASDVDESSAILTGELTELEGYDSATVLFEWGESDGDLPNTTDEQTVDSIGEFTNEVSGLDSDSEYEFRALADVGDDDDTGGTRTFRTEDGSDDDEDDDEIEADPEIDEFELEERNAGPWTRIRVRWTVSHDNGALEAVETVVDGMGTETTSVSGDEYSGHHDHRERNGGGTYKVTLTVADSEGDSTSKTKDIEL